MTQQHDGGRNLYPEAAARAASDDGRELQKFIDDNPITFHDPPSDDGGRDLVERLRDTASNMYATEAADEIERLTRVIAELEADPGPWQITAERLTRERDEARAERDAATVEHHAWCKRYHDMDERRIAEGKASARLLAAAKDMKPIQVEREVLEHHGIRSLLNRLDALAAAVQECER